MFIATYKMKRANLLPSFMLTGAVFFAGFWLIAVLYDGGSPIARILVIALAVILFFIFVFGVYFLIGYLVFNARSMLKKEGGGLSHLLTLFAAVAITIALIIAHLLERLTFSLPEQMLLSAIYAISFYYLVHFTQFLIAIFLENIQKPKLNKDYVIVLGCQIKDGEVTPLLRKRLDKAIAFYRKQERVHTPPRLVLSGGQGKDESRSEASAMADYAVSCGIPESDLILEEQSTSTAENFLYSKELIASESKDPAPKVIFCTSNYHLFRAKVYARKAGFITSGIGARTALYYLPTSVIREYIAYLAMYLRWNIAISTITLIFGVIGAIWLSTF